MYVVTLYRNESSFKPHETVKQTSYANILPVVHLDILPIVHLDRSSYVGDTAYTETAVCMGLCSRCGG